MNVSDLPIAPLCKCVIPEAVIPLGWRIVIILNLVFTFMVYFSFVSEGIKTPSVREMLRVLKNADSFKVARHVIWMFAFCFLLVLPYTERWMALFQMASILLMLGLLFLEKR